MIRISILGFGLVLLTLAAGAGVANEHPSSSLAVASKAGSGLSSVDYNFVAQANLGAPFQIASGRIAENKATTADIRNYAHLMVVTHIPVVDDLNAILRRKQIAPPPDTLLRGAYNAMIATQGRHSTATMWRGRSNIRKATTIFSDTKSGPAPTQILRNLPNAPSARSMTTCNGP